MKQLMKIDNYDSYLKNQWKEIDRLYELKLFSKHIDIISKLDIEQNKVKKILCVGSRYGIELMAFRELGYIFINAIDIYPRSNEIIKADMHSLPFNDNSFDIIYTHHSLDHSLFPKKAVNEMFRVSKPNSFWIHTIPFNDFGKEEAIDFDSANEIVDFLETYTKKIIYKQVVSRNEEGFVIPIGCSLPKNWKNELRIIIKTNK